MATSFEEFIGDVLLGKCDPETAKRRAAVKLACMHRIHCECGKVLSQRSACLWHRAEDGKTLCVLCPSCSEGWQIKLNEMHSALCRKNGFTTDNMPEYQPTFRVDDWNCSYPA